MLDDEVCGLFNVGIRHLGIRAHALRRDDRHAVAFGEIVESIVRRDEVALALRNRGDLLLDLCIERIELGEVGGAVRPNLLLMLGHELGETVRRLLCRLLVKRNAEPEVRVDDALAVLFHAQYSVRREVRRHRRAALFKDFDHLSFEMQPVVKHEISILELFEIRRLSNVKMWVFSRWNDEVNIDVVARQLLRHIGEKRRRHRDLLLARGRIPRRTAAARCQKHRREAQSQQKQPLAVPTKHPLQKIHTAPSFKIFLACSIARSSEVVNEIEYHYFIYI